jgi:hypothetical protein
MLKNFITASATKTMAVWWLQHTFQPVRYRWFLAKAIFVTKPPDPMSAQVLSYTTIVTEYK